MDAGPPVMLTAEVLDRRQTSFRLSWTAPAGAMGYQVRYAKAAITATNFDDTAVTTAVPYLGTPAAAGALDGLTVSGLYIETGYFFAVRATGAGGAQISMQATSAPVTARFRLTQLATPSTANEQLGYSLSADGDLNRDGLSDVLAGTYLAGKAYLFFGNAAGGSSPPAVTFTGASTGFGAAVAQIGDIDGDGVPDLAIGDPTNAAGPSVFIYRGRVPWPAALSDAQADYVVRGGTGYAGSLLGTSLARLGDFTGDGRDDFAIGARGFGTSVGQVVIIPGRASAFPAMITLPDAANAIVINGDSTLSHSFFGYRVLGLGHFYNATAGTTLVVSAPGTMADTASNAGRVYAFHGQAGTAGTIALPADHVTVGSAPNARVGLTLANLGPVTGALPAVGIGNPLDTVDLSGVSGVAFVTTGSVAAGPFANKTVLWQGGGAGVGGLLLGGGASGRDGALSLIGDGAADVVLGAEQSTTVAILDGAKLSAKTSPVETNAAAEVKVSLPEGWSTGEGAASIVPDINGDSKPDFCVGNSFRSVVGGIAVYW